MWEMIGLGYLVFLPLFLLLICFSAEDSEKGNQKIR